MRTWSKFSPAELAKFVADSLDRAVRIDRNRTDLLQEQDGVRKLVRLLYEALLERDIRYAPEKYNPKDAQQVIRRHSEILDSPGEGTCLDLAVLFAGLLYSYGLLPVLIVTERHALVAVSTGHRLADWDAFDRPEYPVFESEPLDDPQRLRELVDRGSLMAVECTGFAASGSLPETVPEGKGRIRGLLPFDRAVAAGREQLDDPGFRFALDVATARFGWGIEPPELPSDLQIAVEDIVIDLRPEAGARADRLPAQPAARRLRRSTAPPLRGVPGFVDRTEQLDALVDRVGAGDGIALSGETGIGRTALVRHAVHERRSAICERPDGVAYVAGSGLTADDLVQNLWESFFESDQPIKVTRARAGRDLASIRAAVIIDDVADGGSLELIGDLAPQSALLATGGAMAPGAIGSVTIAGLAPGDGFDLLVRTVGWDPSDDEAKLAEEIVERLDGHPGRIVAAGSAIRDGASTFRSMVDELRGGGRDAPLGALTSRERELLLLLGAFEGESLSRSRLDRLIDGDAGETLRRLERRGLVVSHSPRYSVPGWLAADLATAAPDRIGTWRARVVEHFGSNRPEPSSAFEDRRALARVFEWARRAGDRATLFSVGSALDRPLAASGEWDAWRSVMAGMVAEARTAGDRAILGRALHQLGTRALGLGEESARPLLEEALEIRTGIGDQAGIAVTRHNLDLLPPAPPTETGPDDGGAPPDEPPGPPPKPPRPRWVPWALGIGAAAIVLGGGAAAVCGLTDVCETTVTTTPPDTTAAVRPGTLRIEPESVEFGETGVGVAEVSAVELIAGDGAVQLTEGRVEPDDVFDVADTNCPDELAEGEACEVRIAFVPAQEGEMQGRLFISTDTGEVSIPLFGIGRGTPEVVARPGFLGFDRVPFGDAVENAVIIENPGDGALEIGEPFVDGDGFSIAGSGCGSELEPGGGCELVVRFEPEKEPAPGDTFAEPYEALLVVPTGAGDVDIPLVGTGYFILPDLTVELERAEFVLDFPTGVDVDVVVRNEGDDTAPGVTIAFLAGGEVMFFADDEQIVREIGDLEPGDEVRFGARMLPVDPDPAAPLPVEAFVDPCDDDPWCSVMERNEDDNMSRAVEVNPVVAVSEVTLEGSADVVGSTGSNLGDLVADAVLFAALREAEAGAPVPAARLSLVPAGSIRDRSIDGGEVRRLQLLLAGDGTVVVSTTSPSGLLDALEHAVALIDEPGPRFLQVAATGFSWFTSEDPPRVADVCDGPIVRSNGGWECPDGHIVDNGDPIGGGDLPVGTTSRVVDGRDGSPLAQYPFEDSGVLLGYAVEQWVIDALGGRITADRYPEGDPQRILEFAPFVVD